MSIEKPQLSFGEKLGLVPVILRTLTTAIVSIFAAPLRGESGAPTVFRHVAYAAVRQITATASIAQTQYLSPTTEEQYLTLAKQKGFQPDTVRLQDGTKAHWVGNKGAEKVMVYCHGGGYALPATPAHLQFLWEIKTLLSDLGSDVAILILSYTLAPERQYPRQLEQGVETLRYVIETMGKAPSNVVLAGDSAGGNLALAVLSHVSHKHPSIQPISLSEPLRAAILISPWCTFADSADAIKRNANKDCTSYPALRKWSDAFMGSAPSDYYNQPHTAPGSWWEGLKVSEVLILAGADELLVDDIKALAGRIEEVHEKTTTIVTQGESHDAPILDLAFGYKEPGEQMNAINSWISPRL
ncbi:MAG: hypothetical protein M1827_004401 [Pycnora praestabilis]|nr:MAG: hypothetical protein M1827_004401 [Pycnora praestabilis]